jgi:hypothetical protein
VPPDNRLSIRAVSNVSRGEVRLTVLARMISAALSSILTSQNSLRVAVEAERGQLRQLFEQQRAEDERDDDVLTRSSVRGLLNVCRLERRGRRAEESLRDGGNDGGTGGVGKARGEGSERAPGEGGGGGAQASSEHLRDSLWEGEGRSRVFDKFVLLFPLRRPVRSESLSRSPRSPAKI